MDNNNIIITNTSTYSKLSDEIINNNQEEDNLFAFYIEGLTLTLVSIFGLLGNLLSLIVLFRKIFRNSFSNLLKGLAMCDALFLLTAIISFGLPNLSASYSEMVLMKIAPVMFGLLHTFRVGSVYVTMAVTFERYLAIVFPLHSFSKKKLLLPTSLIFAILYNLPKYFEITTVWNDHLQVHNIESTSLRNNSLYVTLYVVWSKLILTELLPYMTILILNILIVVKTVKASSFRKQFTMRTMRNVEVFAMHRVGDSSFGAAMSGWNGSADEHECELLENNNKGKKGYFSKVKSAMKSYQRTRSSNLNRTLISISVLFILCQSFKIIPDLYELMFCSDKETRCNAPQFVNVIVKFSHLLVCVNSSANFLFYFLQGKKFQRAFWDTFLGRKI